MVRDEKNTTVMTQAEDESSTATEKENHTSEKPLHFDDVLINELGQFGWFQQRNVILFIAPMIIFAFVNEYVFSAAAIPHRCRIPECSEEGKSHEYEPEWILNAVPKTSSGFSSCQRYAPTALEINGTLDYCPEMLFDQSITIPCEGYVYASNISVVYDFDLGCQDWLRALAGTVNSIGTLLALPITGYISDRFGRKIVLVINAFNLGLFGLIRAFSVNYTMYMILQILQTTFGTGISSTAYVFGTELVGPRYRVLTSAILSSGVVMGQMILGSIAWLISPWRYMIMAVTIPCFFIVSYYWILPESVRWLLAKRKYTRAKKILETVAKVNKTRISEKSLDALMNPPRLPTVSADLRPRLVDTIIKSPVLLKRVCTTPIWWITAVFIFYGLSINSTGLSDKMYLNYILTNAAAVPGFFASTLVLDRFGRKATLCIGFFLCAACNFTFIFIPNELAVLRLITYLFGMFFISLVLTSLYLYTSELYPTEFRHSLLGFSSMIGRIGSIMAPLTPVLVNYWHGIPPAMFGSMGIISGLLVLTQPETLGTKLPDTLADAEDLGKPESKLKAMM